MFQVQNNLCTPKNGEILVASTQDFLTSSFLITRKDTFYDRSEFSLMCSYMDDGMDPVDLPTPAIMKPIELWTGKQLFSILVRPQALMRVYINLTVLEKNYTYGETMCPSDGFVYFRNSELVCGQLGKVTLGFPGDGSKKPILKYFFEEEFKIPDLSNLIDPCWVTFETRFVKQLTSIRGGFKLQYVAYFDAAFGDQHTSSEDILGTSLNFYDKSQWLIRLLKHIAAIMESFTLKFVVELFQSKGFDRLQSSSTYVIGFAYRNAI
ncbi:hypothetical protein GIB67_018513 [Kingdonia uniflora]|uniref:DNA-directed RNA polymerase n=1 Tax=Kingdonia uniflora TaxID=39325 RepID=A0A7J7LWF5_9MAGN|nr:hypothetical protein GIB67_018513 [Kingdonia uniflora]